MRRRLHLFAIALISAMMVCACTSATRSIGQAARDIRNEAQGIQGDLEDAKGSGEVGPGAIPFVDSAQERARNIEGITQERIEKNITKIEDKTHPLIRLLQIWGWIVLILAIVGGLMYLGVGPIIRKLFNLAGWFIPQPVRSEARRDAELISSGEDIAREQVRRIELRKTTSAAYRKALEQELARIKENEEDTE